MGVFRDNTGELSLCHFVSKAHHCQSNFHFCTFSIAHSNYYAGFRMYHFEQFYTFRNEIDVPVFENLKAYRNREWGIYIYSE